MIHRVRNEAISSIDLSNEIASADEKSAEAKMGFLWGFQIILIPTQ